MSITLSVFQSQGWCPSYNSTSFEDNMGKSEEQEIMADRGRETVS